MNLAKGSIGKTVKALQEFLREKGYLKGAADGEFGLMTDEALRYWQSDNNLRVDGIFGQNSLFVAKEQGFQFEANVAVVGGGSAGIKDALILISAGHGGIDSGAVGNGFIEAKEAVKIRDEVAKILRESGFSVITDGADGENEPLKKAIILAQKADIAIEIHFNASVNEEASGVEVLAKPNLKKLSQSLAQGIASELKLKTRGGDGGYKSDSSGQHHRLAFCEAGGAIVEVCFISNPNDMKSYVANFDSMCKVIADVLANRS